MFLGRVLLRLGSTKCSRSVRLQTSFAVCEVSARRLHHVCPGRSQTASGLRPSARRLGHELRTLTRLHQLAAWDMQPVGLSRGKEATAIPSDGGGGDEDEGGGGCVGAAGRESGMGEEALAELTVTRGRVGPAGTGDQQAAGAAAAPGSDEKKSKSQMRRERKRSVKQKKLKSSDSLDSLMSELPFALTSPTTWKELGFIAPVVPSPEPAHKKRKRKRGDSGGGRVDSEEDADKKKKKKDSHRPNYFVSIPITNAQISSAVTEVQEAVLQQEPRLSRAMIPVPTLHITLLVTHLASQEQIDQAAAVLAQVEPSLAELLGGRDLVLPFSGVGHFRREVVFVGLAPGQHRRTLDSLAELLRSRFEEAGLLQGDGRGFEPHLTIMKLSRASKLRSQGIKRVDPALYSNYADKFFGDQPVERLDLCSMLKKKQRDGYYHTETSLRLDLTPLHAKRSSGRRRSEPDEAELLRVSRRLVEDAVNRALQQYKQEALQNGGGPNAAAVQLPGDAEETATKTDTTPNSATDNRK